MALDGDDLPKPSRSNQFVMRAKLSHVEVCCRILDQIGWDDHESEDTYRLVVDPDVRTAVATMVGNASEYVDDQVFHLEAAREAGDTERLEKLEMSAADARETLNGLLAIGAAVGTEEPALA